MRADVVLTPAEVPGQRFEDRVAVVVDVLRASTSVVAACAAGCAGVLPVVDVEAAWAEARLDPHVVLAGERGGEPIPGFALGNSPLEFTAERVRGRLVVLTTTNGTRAMVAARAASATAIGALTNVGAVARWTAAQGRDLVVLCAGEAGGFALEDAVCAGLLVERLLASGAPLECSDSAVAARRLGEHYRSRLQGLLEDSAWARSLVRAGRERDVAASLRLDDQDQVPVLRGGVIVPTARPQAERDRASGAAR